MSTPPPDYRSPAGFRELNRRMAQEIQNAAPAPYVEGGYARRVSRP